MTPLALDPSGWLLARYDERVRDQDWAPSNYTRPLFEVRDDHSHDCIPDASRCNCFTSSAVAVSWPFDAWHALDDADDLAAS